MGVRPLADDREGGDAQAGGAHRDERDGFDGFVGFHGAGLELADQAEAVLLPGGDLSGPGPEFDRARSRG